MIAVLAVLALLEALSATWSNTIAGAVTPIITALLFIPVRMLYRKVEKVLDQARKNHDLTATEVSALKAELAEAKAAIRGDLANGVKKKLDQIAEQVAPEEPREVKD